MKQSGSVTANPRFPAPPSPEEVRSQLEHILASPSLQASERRRAFLRFIVEETLAGRAGSLKGYTIAVSVFKRDESFDSQSDPVVRVEARRLRRDLDSYYMHAGDRDSVRISIPKGAYVPHFETAFPPESPMTASEVRPARSNQITETAGRGKKSAASALTNRPYLRDREIAAVVILVIIVIAFSAWNWMNRSENSDPTETAMEPSVLVLPFEALGPSAVSSSLATGISQELVGDLMRFPGLRLYATSPGWLDGPNTAPAEVKPPPEVTYVVSGSVREDGDQVHVVSQMVFASTHRVVWTETYDLALNPNAMIQLQRDLAGDIATELGQPYGYLHSDVESQVSALAVSNMQSYLCVQRAYDYRRNFSREQFEPLMECLTNAVKSDPQYADAWAMLGWLHMDAGRYDFGGSGQMQQEYETALQLATHAASLEPENSLVLKVLSSIDHYMGHFEESEQLARRAADINPNDPDTLAQLGWRLAVRGNFDEGIPILRRAIDRTVNPPGWYFHLVALHLYVSGQYQQMRSVAERSAIDGSGFSQALIAIASGALDDREGARQALEKIPPDSLLSRDPSAFMRRHGATEELVDSFTEGLARAHSVASLR